MAAGMGDRARFADLDGAISCADRMAAGNRKRRVWRRKTGSGPTASLGYQSDSEGQIRGANGNQGVAPIASRLLRAN